MPLNVPCGKMDYIDIDAMSAKLDTAYIERERPLIPIPFSVQSGLVRSAEKREGMAEKTKGKKVAHPKNLPRLLVVVNAQEASLRTNSKQILITISNKNEHQLRYRDL